MDREERRGLKPTFVAIYALCLKEAQRRRLGCSVLLVSVEPDTDHTVIPGMLPHLARKE
jgi:hypothetical protein